MIKLKVLAICAVAGTIAVLSALGLSGGSAAQDVDPAELVKDIHAIFGEHHARAVHAKGVVLDATFEPTSEARQLSKAGVFLGKVQATVRLSDTTGIPEIPDADPNASPHGLAIKFKLDDGTEMDLVIHSFNGFPAATAAEFDTFLKAVAASGPGVTKPTPIEKYLQAHPKAVPFASRFPAPCSMAPPISALSRVRSMSCSWFKSRWPSINLSWWLQNRTTSPRSRRSTAAICSQCNGCFARRGLACAK
jgi:catalase